MQPSWNIYSIQPSVTHSFLTFKRWGRICAVKAGWPMPLPALEMNRHVPINLLDPTLNRQLDWALWVREREVCTKTARSNFLINLLTGADQADDRC